MDEWAKTKNMKARTPKAKQNEDLKLKKIRQIVSYTVYYCNCPLFYFPQLTGH
jgi:hypothetical protein